jgi:hypothetical protein
MIGQFRLVAELDTAGPGLLPPLAGAGVDRMTKIVKIGEIITNPPRLEVRSVRAMEALSLIAARRALPPYLRQKRKSSLLLARTAAARMCTSSQHAGIS